jgi:hypothetical protein
MEPQMTTQPCWQPLNLSPALEASYTYPPAGKHCSLTGIAVQAHAVPRPHHRCAAHHIGFMQPALCSQHTRGGGVSNYALFGGPPKAQLVDCLIRFVISYPRGVLISMCHWAAAAAAAAAGTASHAMSPSAPPTSCCGAQARTPPPSFSQIPLRTCMAWALPTRQGQKIPHIHGLGPSST